MRKNIVTLFSSRNLLLKLLPASVVVATLVFYLPGMIFGAGSQMLFNRIEEEQSKSLNVPFRTNTFVFDYTGGNVMVTSCLNQACTWAIDDAAQLIVVRPDGTQISRDLISDTKEKPAENVTSLFQVGTNTVTIHLVDRFAPVRGLSKPLYLVESQTQLPAPRPQAKSLPIGMKSTNHPYILYSKDPVNTFTGSFYFSRNDITIQGRGPVPAFTRRYDSTNNISGPLGPGWTHNYAMQLIRPDETTNDLVLIGPEGRADRFTFNSDKYSAPAGINISLTKNSNGTYTATQKDQSTWTFDEAGKLARITDRYGNQSTLGYDTDGRLVSVSDPAGRGSLTLVNDSSGKITNITDWTDRVVRYNYDGSGRLSTVIDREGNVTTYTYDGATSRIATIKDARNNIVVTNIYDAEGRVTTQKDARGLTTGQQTTFAYNTNSDGTKTTSVTYPKTSFEPTWSLVEEDTYDTQGRILKRVSKPVSNSANWITQEYTYDIKGNRASFKDGRGNLINYCYDVDYAGAVISGSRGNLTRVIEPAPASDGNVLVSLNKYDEKNNLIQSVSPKGVTTGTSANCLTNFSSSIDMTYSIDYSYDTEKTKLISITKRFNEPSVGLKTAVTKYEYTDAANPGFPTKEINPRGNTGATPDYTYATVLTYFTSGDKAGMLESTTNPAGAVTKYDYDSVGRKTAMINPKGNVAGGTASAHASNYAYDKEDHLRFAKAPAPVAGQGQLVTETRYDAVGNKTSVIDANGQVTRYVYDERDSLKEVHQSPNTWTDPSINPTIMITTAYQYDHLGNLTRISRVKGNSLYERVSDYVFDGLNRVMKETQYPNWPSTSTTLVSTYAYDKNSNKSSTKDPLGKTTTYAYDALNRLTNIIYNSTTTPNVTFSYDANSNRTKMVDGTGTSTYTYDELNRMLSVQNSDLKTVGYRYDLDGNRSKLIYPDNTAVTYTFDKTGRLDNLVDWSNRKTSYGYYIDGMPKTVTNEINNSSTNYTYDNASRMAQVWNKLGENTISQHNYKMDSVGNRTHIDIVKADSYTAGPITDDRKKSIDYTYDKLNQLIKENNAGKIVEYTYDPAGNKLSEKIDTLTVNYTYDKADRINTTTESNRVYIVDANGNIIKRNYSFGPTEIAFNYDQANRMVQVKDLTYYYDGDGKRTKIVKNLTARDRFIYDVNQDLPQIIQDNGHKYVYGLDLVYTVNNDNKPFVYHADGLGSIQAISDNSFFQPLVYAYNEYSSYGYEGIGAAAMNDQPFRFTGEYQDDINFEEFINLRARYYYPKIGRFMSRDSVIGDITNPLSLNRYTYAHNNPTNLVDSSGNVVWVPVMIGIGAGVGATLNVLASDDKSLNGVVDAAWKGAAAGAAGTTIAVGSTAILATAGVTGVTAAIASGASSGFVGNTTLNYLDGDPLLQDAAIATFGGAVLGPIADEVVPTVGRPVSKLNWSYMPRGKAGPNTMAIYDREFLSNLYQGLWGYGFKNTKK